MPECVEVTRSQGKSHRKGWKEEFPDWDFISQSEKQPKKKRRYIRRNKDRDNSIFLFGSDARKDSVLGCDFVILKQFVPFGYCF